MPKEPATSDSVWGEQSSRVWEGIQRALNPEKPFSPKQRWLLGLPDGPSSGGQNIILTTLLAPTSLMAADLGADHGAGRNLFILESLLFKE